ncbi:MAG: NYN domain-containing protein [Clostridiales bacterium]|jgi:uncharacterized protein (TIGR00288 family)|nr:NYN domain-containing protein [Clostridiales bacterium]
MNEKYQIALLIDGDNIESGLYGTIMNELKEFGRVVYKGVYGDFSKSKPKKWAETAKYNGIELRYEAPVKGKNSADILMVIDAMDLLYANGNIDCFCIATSDRDFVGLISRLKKSGMFIIGAFEAIANDALKNNYDHQIPLSKKEPVKAQTNARAEGALHSAAARQNIQNSQNIQPERNRQNGGAQYEKDGQNIQSERGAQSGGVQSERNGKNTQNIQPERGAQGGNFQPERSRQNTQNVQERDRQTAQGSSQLQDAPPEVSKRKYTDEEIWERTRLILSNYKKDKNGYANFAGILKQLHSKLPGLPSLKVSNFEKFFDITRGDKGALIKSKV